jgi:hypothetical protein
LVRVGILFKKSYKTVSQRSAIGKILINDEEDKSGYLNEQDPEYESNSSCTIDSNTTMDQNFEKP